ncbi:hypothetical protein AALO_G00141800 [Alosa alosa]|uniref:Reverse transcriptase domain-containing protein n=1 Tax=Alosa alosa TaxID=278164 RepID=A0AAV6GJ46_9TELE|nr:hypothetical protein AALO_G00141800 [Alosa alosa]
MGLPEQMGRDVCFIAQSHGHYPALQASEWAMATGWVTPPHPTRTHGGAVGVLQPQWGHTVNSALAPEEQEVEEEVEQEEQQQEEEEEKEVVEEEEDYLTERPQFVRLKNCLSDTVICSTGAPQGTVLSPVLFTLYTSDFCYTESCHMQKFSDDTAIVGCIRNGQEEEYRSLVEDFVQWCKLNHLQLNTSKTKEMVVDFLWRSKPTLLPVHIDGVNVEVVSTYKYLGLHLDNKLDWSANTDALYKKGQSRLYFLRRLWSFNVCSKLLKMFYQSVVASVLFYAVVCWGGSTKKKDAGRIDRLVRKAGSVVGAELECITSLSDKGTLNKLVNILDNECHPLHSTTVKQKSLISWRLRSLPCTTDRLRKSFVPRAIALFNASLKGRVEIDFSA